MLKGLAAKVCSEDDIVLVDTVDGYLTALACGPIHADPLQAMDALYGDEWAAVLDEQDLTDPFMEALHRRWTEITEALAPALLEFDREQMQLTPLLTLFDDATLAELIASGIMRFDEMPAPPADGVLWVQGFLRAVRDHDADWHRFDPKSEVGLELDGMLMAIAAVAMAPGEQLERFLTEAYDDPANADQGVLLDDALFCVQDLKLFWQRPETRQLLS